MIVDALQTVGIVMILVAAGYALFKIGWIENEHIKPLTRLVVNVALPCLTAVNLFTFITPELLSQSGLSVLVSIAGVLFGAGIGVLGSRVMGVPNSRRGLVIGMSAFSNSLFVGLPMVSGILGDAAIPFVLYFYIANSTLFWTMGLYLIQRDASGGAIKFWSLNAFKRLCTPPLVSFFVCMILVVCGVRLPQFALKTLDYLGSIVTPFSLILIGAIIGRCGIKGSFRFERGMETILLSRFLFSPALTFIAAYLCGIEPLGVSALTLMVAMPTMSQAVMQSEQYGGDVEFAAKMTVISTLLCLVTIPLTSIVMPLIY